MFRSANWRFHALQASDDDLAVILKQNWQPVLPLGEYIAVKITFIVPTYNEAENLPKLVSAFFALPVPDLNLLIVDDNSPDGTGQMADDLCRQWNGRMDVIHRAGKMGLGTAYITGFQVLP